MSRQEGLVRTERQSLVQSDQRPAVAPACDVYENNDEILVVADVPGVSAEDLDINLDKGESSLPAGTSRRRKGHSSAWSTAIVTTGGASPCRAGSTPARSARSSRTACSGSTCPSPRRSSRGRSRCAPAKEVSP